jgi:hypothetical protein
MPNTQRTSGMRLRLAKGATKMSTYRWCSRCHCGFDADLVDVDSRGDHFCPECGASAVYIAHWSYARSLHKAFPAAPEHLTRYEPELPPRD